MHKIPVVETYSMQKQTGKQKIIPEGKNVENGFSILTLHLICHQT